MPSRRLATRLLLGAVVLLLVARYAGGVSWAARAAVGLLLATVVIQWGLASMRPLRAGEKSYAPVDVVDEEGIPVYSCKECGTQLVLLRRGSDKAPRHCGEAMAFAIVSDASEGSDGSDVPDYPPDDL